jgi:hypothetical protein
MRLLFPVGLIGSVLCIAGAVAVGCGGVALPPGGATGPVVGAPASLCSADGTYYQVTSADCGFLNCPAGLTAPAYALCDGTSWSACTCTKPPAGSGWTEIQQNKEKDSGGFPDVQAIDTSEPDTHVPPVDSSSDVTDTGVHDTAPSESASEGGPGETGASDSPSKE